MAENNKVTWRTIYNDFRKRHPTLKKEVIYWCPYDFATILMHLENQNKATYNYDTKEVRFIK